MCMYIIAQMQIEQLKWVHVHVNQLPIGFARLTKDASRD
jgi:hypothetical protein